MVGSSGFSVQKTADLLAIAAVELAKTPSKAMLSELLLQLLLTANTMGVKGDDLIIMAEQKLRINNLKR